MACLACLACVACLAVWSVWVVWWLSGGCLALLSGLSSQGSASPKRFLRRAKTRSQDAELGEMAKTMRAASAHAGKEVPLVRHHPRMAFE